MPSDSSLFAGKHRHSSSHVFRTVLGRQVLSRSHSISSIRRNGQSSVSDETSAKLNKVLDGSSSLIKSKYGQRLRELKGEEYASY